MKKARIKNRICLRSRAILKEDKESRLQDFLNAAAKLFDQEDFDRISVSDICKAAGLAKGTFYLYFKTKEEVFLALTRNLLAQWNEQISVKLSLLSVPANPSAFAEVLAQSFRGLPQVPRLLQMLHSVLEQNVSQESILDFKKAVALGNDSLALQVSRIFPNLAAAQLQMLMLFCQVTLTGTWQFANPPPNVRKILEANGLERFLFSFESAVEQQTIVFLAGLGFRGK